MGAGVEVGTGAGVEVGGLGVAVGVGGISVAVVQLTPRTRSTKRQANKSFLIIDASLKFFKAVSLSWPTAL